MRNAAVSDYRFLPAGQRPWIEAVDLTVISLLSGMTALPLHGPGLRRVTGSPPLRATRDVHQTAMREDMEHITPAFRTNRLLQGLVIWLLLLWIVTSIEPFNRRDWLLENLLVFVYGALLVASYRRFAFSNRSYLLFTIFMSLHLSLIHI